MAGCCWQIANGTRRVPSQEKLSVRQRLNARINVVPLPILPIRGLMKVRTILFACLLLAVSGCSRLTVQNYSKIAVGMSYGDVTGFIGTPTKCDDVMSLRNCTWKDGKRSVSVTFAGGKVLLFSSSNLN